MRPRSKDRIAVGYSLSCSQALIRMIPKTRCVRFSEGHGFTRSSPCRFGAAPNGRDRDEFLDQPYRKCSGALRSGPRERAGRAAVPGRRPRDAGSGRTDRRCARDLYEDQIRRGRTAGSRTAGAALRKPTANPIKPQWRATGSFREGGIRSGACDAFSPAGPIGCWLAQTGRAACCEG